MYGKRIDSNGRKFCLYVTLKCKGSRNFRVWAEEEGRKNSRYVERLVKVDGERTVYLSFPITPDSLILGVADANSPQSKDFQVSVSEKPLRTYNIWLDGGTRKFLNLAYNFVEVCGYENGSKTGRNFTSRDDEFTIRYFDVIRDVKTGRAMGTPARIGHKTGRIEVSKAKFDRYTIPMRMMILLHEYSHKFKNPKIGLEIDNEIGADINALYIYLGLGFSKIDAICVFGKVFLKAQSKGNIERMRKIMDYINKFESEQFAEKDFLGYMSEWDEEYEYEEKLLDDSSGLKNPNAPYEDDVTDPLALFDDAVMETDFSEIRGNKFGKILKKTRRKVTPKKLAKRRPSRAKKPLSKEFGVKRDADISGGKKQLSNVIVPRNRKVIVEGVSDFILSTDKKDDSVRNIGYYKGKKLKQLVLTFNNDSAIDFELELFNPSMPLDYLYSTSLNINDKITVAGGIVSYTDVLHNLLANPTFIPNAKFVYSGAQLSAQKSQSLIFKNRNDEGKQKVHPLNLDIEVDRMQEQNNIIFFDIMEGLNRPFIPDGMDVIGYKVLAGMTVTMAFFYEQVSLKKVFYQEARDSKKLL